MSVATASLPIIGFYDSHGRPAYSGRVWTYLAGTTTPAPTYQDSTGMVANTNPIQLNARGEAAIWFDPSLVYDLAPQMANGTALPRQSNVRSPLSAGDLQTAISGLPANVLNHGAVGDGVADDTAAINAALLSYKHVVVPEGVSCVTDILNLRNGQLLEINGTLKRKAGATNGAMIFGTGVTGFSIFGTGTVDGNKAAQSVGAHSITLTNCANYHIEGLRLIGSKAASGYGAAIAISAGSNNTMVGKSSILNCEISNCDAMGIQIANDFSVEVASCNLHDNAGQGISAAFITIPPTVASTVYMNFHDNQCRRNGGSGIEVNGFITGGSIAHPIYSHSPVTTYHCKIHDNICESNAGYGIAAQGTGISVTNNNCLKNGGTSGLLGDILFGVDSGVCSGNISDSAAFFGIDAGASWRSTIIGNNINGAGIGAGTGGIGLNIGATIDCDVAHNIVRLPNIPNTVGYQCSGFDTDGVAAFDWLTNGTRIKSNKLIGNSLSSSLGYVVDYDSKNIEFTDNECRYLPILNGFQLRSPFMKIARNTHWIYADSGLGVSPVLPSASTLVIADEVDDLVLVTGTTTIGALLTYSAASFSGLTRTVTITAGGTGYTTANPPTVAFSGGGGSGASGTAVVSNSGAVIAVAMTGYGSGYTSAPTVTFSGGAGSGATGTANINCANFEGRVVTLLTVGACTVTDGGVLNLNGNFVGTPGSLLTLRGYAGKWNEQSRNIQ